MKQPTRRQVIYIIAGIFLVFSTALLTLSTLRPKPARILTGKWKKVSTHQEKHLAFYADGKTYSYTDGKRKYQGKYKFIDRETIKVDYYMSTSYYKIHVIGREKITITDESNRTTTYLKIRD